MWFATGVAGLWAVCAATFLPASMTTMFTAPHLAWLALLSLAGLAFPAVVLSFVFAPRFSRAAAYCGTLLLCGALAGVMAAWAGSAPKWAFLRDFAGMLPFANVFFSLDLDALSTGTFLVQGALSFAILGAGFWNARHYAQALTLITTRERRIARETGIVPR